jgi:pilus assembly protein Flp/PilA
MKFQATRFLKDESGATAIEYGLIAATLALGIMVGLNQIKNSVQALYVNINGGLNP